MARVQVIYIYTGLQYIFTYHHYVPGPGQGSKEDNSEKGRQAHCGPRTQSGTSQMLEFQSQRDLGTYIVQHPHFTDEQTMILLLLQPYNLSMQEPQGWP